MSTNELAFAEIPHDGPSGIREWALRGPGGAVNFLWSSESGGHGLVIGIHGTPEADDPAAVPCDLLEGGHCHPDQAFTAAAALGITWVQAGRDDAVIRSELASWYERLAPA